MSLQIGQLEKAFPNLPKVTEVFVDPAEKYLMAELQNGKKVVLAEVVKHAVVATPNQPKQKRTYKKRVKAIVANGMDRPAMVEDKVHP